MKLWSSVLVLGLLTGTSSIGMASDADDSDIGGRKEIRRKHYQTANGLKATFDGREWEQKRKKGVPTLEQKPTTPATVVVVETLGKTSRAETEASQAYHRRAQRSAKGTPTYNGADKPKQPVIVTAPRPKSSANITPPSTGHSKMGKFAEPKPTPFSTRRT